MAVCDLAISSARKFADAYSAPIPQRSKIVKMLINLRDLQSWGPLTESELLKLMTNAVAGDTIVVPIQAQNACVILRRFSNSTIHEAFEIDPPNTAVISSDSERLIRSFPGPALEIADTASTGPKFISHFVCLASMDVPDLHSAASSNKVKTKVMEVHDTADPHFITQFFTAILHGLPGSKPVAVERVEMVAIQTTLTRFEGREHGYALYKCFMLFLFAETMSLDPCRGLPTDLIVCTKDKVARRLRKLSDADIVPEFLARKIMSALEAVNLLLNEGGLRVQKNQALSPHWDPRTLDIAANTRLSLCPSRHLKRTL
ncbi:hypothetical protein DXG03_006745 [Asterophora parasitica]|uniref:DUF6606 domain-containing protein n=1 Tax=Asterophora parasitica TaxID=117018 RepID=A0A9P7K743_9AGAR|nr:hypothetical protein DXG03_006745 [Asterophora parasitica]